jgi:hypothetical protein
MKRNPEKGKTDPEAAATEAGAEKPAASLEITSEERWRMIAQAAYLKAEKRSFEPGHEVEDWLEAEKEVNALLGGVKEPAS